MIPPSALPPTPLAVQGAPRHRKQSLSPEGDRVMKRILGLVPAALVLAGGGLRCQLARNLEGWGRPGRRGTEPRGPCVRPGATRERTAASGGVVRTKSVPVIGKGRPHAARGGCTSCNMV